MMASCGMRARWLADRREDERAEERERQADPVHDRRVRIAAEIGSNSAIVAPSAAICASDRSTKMTPRSTTWTPRYAWMPVRIRLATKGAARNASMDVSSTTSLRSS